MAKSETGIVKAGLQGYGIARAAADALSIVTESLAPGEQLSLSSFDRIKVPTGGSLAWELPWDGEVSKTITGVIIYRRPVKSHYKEAYTGGHQPPDCHSIDMVWGIGDPGGECAKCPFNQFGSAITSDGQQTRGKACDDRTLLFLLTPDSLLPTFINVPPTSYKPCQDYVLREAGRGNRPWHIITELGLEKVEGQGVPAYARMTFRRLEVLSPEEQALVDRYRAQLVPHIESLAANVRTWDEATDEAE